jgi:hypothetical protein
VQFSRSLCTNVVGEDDELMRFQHVAEMIYDLVNGQQLAVVCTSEVGRRYPVGVARALRETGGK